MEQWLSIAGYEGLYEVSSLGRVRSLDRTVWRRSRCGNEYPWLRPGRILRQYRQSDAPKMWRRYWQINLVGNDGVTRHRHVHLLVARAFLGPCPEGQQVRHGPAGSLVNTVDNISYGTAAENQADRERDGTSNRGGRNPMAKLTEPEVQRIRLRYQAGERQKHLATEFGVSRSTISMIVSGRRWT